MLYGAIEGGGTKFVCAVGTSSEDVLDSVVLPTAERPIDAGRMRGVFSTAAQGNSGRSRRSASAASGRSICEAREPSHGQMLATPKPGWSGVDLLKPLRSRFNAPILIDTDVSAAALAEWRLGAGRGLGSIAYVTVGTGIGGGVAPHDLTTRRLMHAEMGHIFVRRDAREPDFPACAHFTAIAWRGSRAVPRSRRDGAVSSMLYRRTTKRGRSSVAISGSSPPRLRSWCRSSALFSAAA